MKKWRIQNLEKKMAKESNVHACRRAAAAHDAAAVDIMRLYVIVPAWKHLLGRK